MNVPPRRSRFSYIPACWLLAALWSGFLAGCQRAQTPVEKPGVVSLNVVEPPKAPPTPVVVVPPIPPPEAPPVPWPVN